MAYGSYTFQISTLSVKILILHRATDPSPINKDTHSVVTCYRYNYSVISSL